MAESPKSQRGIKPPSWNEIRANARQFVPRWADQTSERGEAQTFWNEFLAIFGVDRRRVALFEKHVKRTSTGKDGRIDLYWPGVLVTEHKSAGKSLEGAEAQALDYLDDLDTENVPQVVITSDFATIRILDLSEPGSAAFTFPLGDLVRNIDRFGFIAGYSKSSRRPTEGSVANVQAAKLMGELYEELSQEGFSDHDTSVFLARLLFLMFGDDTGMWARGLFLELLETRTSKDGSDVGAQLTALFRVLNMPLNTRPEQVDELMARLPYVNGGLFAERIDVPFFGRAARTKLLAVAGFDWAKISPAVFGSMFQAVKDKEARRQLGEHYTTEKNILRVIGPLFLDDLHERYEAAKNSDRRLRDLHKHLGQMRFLDPACGCGNFLVIAYRELRRLELAILLRQRVLRGPGFQQDVIDPTAMLNVGLEQFFGIELEEWPSRIAETAMFLVDQQENLALAAEFGVAPDRLPIEVSSKVVRGNAIYEDWLELVGGKPVDDLVILGNPPFIGMQYLSADQQDDNRYAFGLVDSAGLRTGRLDYVASWYAKAINTLRGSTGRAAFVSTNSITQGEQARSMVPLLEREGFKVDFGHRTFRWTSEAPDAAAVHVVVVGFSPAERRASKALFEYRTLTSEPSVTSPERLNFYLVDGPDLVPAKLNAPLVAGMPNASKGSQPTDGGHLIVDADGLAEVAGDPIAAKYLRRFVQARDFLQGGERWCLWLAGAAPGDLHSSPVLRERMKLVREERLKSPTASVRSQAATPSLFTQIRQPLHRYVALPEVSSENREWIPGAVLAPQVIAGNKLIVWNTSELWHLGYLQSSAWMAWVRAYAGRLKSDFSLSPGLSYFPFPFVTPTEPKQRTIEGNMQAILDERTKYIGATLADLYDPLSMPAALRKCHEELDTTIDALYGLKRPTEAARMKAIIREYEQAIAPLLASGSHHRRGTSP